MDQFLIAALVVLLLLSAFCSSSETALFSLSPMKVKAFSQDPHRRKQLVARLLMQPRQLLVTVLIINVIINVLIQNIISNFFGGSTSWLLTVGLPLFLTLVFGEVIPKSLGLANNEKVAYLTAPVLNKAQKLFLPIRKSLVYIAGAISHVIFFFLRKEKEISVEELEHALKTSRKVGVLSEDEGELVRGYLHLEGFHVRELMRQTEEILYFDISENLDRLVHLFVDEECSRIPICEGDIENVIGIMTSRLFFLHRPQIHASEDLKKIVEKAFFVPESMPATTLLREFYARKESMALVVDEYGSISGLLTLEDLIEEVIGEISDRRDLDKRYTRSGEDVLIASGKLELSELEEIFDVPFESEHDVVTIGGWLTEKLGDIPKSGTKYTTKDFLFHILSSDPNRIRRVYIRRLRKPLKES
jgi:magnesium and cobalt exporter, CNNM family